MAFLQKRAHLCAVARGREMFARVADMTPARFDILYLIYEQFIDVVSGLRAGFILQARVPHLLGLRRQTVWEAIERLIELGLVKKTKDLDGPDPRRNIITLTPDGIRRVHEAFGVAFSERLPLPKDAPVDGEVPRYWRRPELADVRRDMGGKPIPPKKEGREVAKIFTRFAWERVGGRQPNRRFRYLAFLDDLMMTTLEVAQALGDTSTVLYPIREPKLTGLPKWAWQDELRAEEHRARGWCDVKKIFVGMPRATPTLAHAEVGRCRVVRASRRRKCRRPSPRPCPIAHQTSTSYAIVA